MLKPIKSLHTALTSAAIAVMYVSVHVVIVCYIKLQDKNEGDTVMKYIEYIMMRIFNTGKGNSI